MVLLDPRSVREDLDLKARYDTLTSDLGTFGKMANALQQTAFGRFILPFATAPTNDVLRTTEFMGINPQAWADMAGQNGPRAQQMAWVASLSAGLRWPSWLSTQQRPSHRRHAVRPKLRDALPPGWQPYSMVFRGEGFPTDEDGDPLPLYDIYGRPNGPLTYVSYAGYGPLTSVIGITADATQRMTMTRDPEQRNNIAAAALMATVDYYKELPMLQGMSDVVAALEYGSIEQLLRGPAQAGTVLGPAYPARSAHCSDRLPASKTRPASRRVTIWNTTRWKRCRLALPLATPRSCGQTARQISAWSACRAAIGMRRPSSCLARSTATWRRTACSAMSAM
jgi:hypothetical protein